MTWIFAVVDTISIWAGRLVCAAAVLLAGITAFTWVVERVMKRAGMAGLFLTWCFQEHAKSARGFWARMFWGGAR